MFSIVLLDESRTFFIQFLDGDGNLYGGLTLWDFRLSVPFLVSWNDIQQCNAICVYRMYSIGDHSFLQFA